MKVEDIEIADFDYDLPDASIAKHPLAERDECRLLVRRGDGAIEDHIFRDVTDLLSGDSMLVCNNTRVINARLRFHKPTGGVVEVFCLEPLMPADYEQSFGQMERCTWKCIVGNSKRWKGGDLTMMVDVDGVTVELKATRLEKNDVYSVVEFSWMADGVSFSRLIEAAGEIPIPPYLNRGSEDSDRTDYQTVYSRIDGSVAAPTAGLHFTDRVFEGIRKRGIDVKEVTLHVGAGTFKPVATEKIGGHPMHSEFISVGRGVIEALMEHKGRIVAVGTTSVRTLESLYHLGCMAARGEEPVHLGQWRVYEDGWGKLSRRESMMALLKYLDQRGLPTLTASTQIIIAPGYEFRVVDVIITNFHQPQSTLLLLVSAFTAGHWREMYEHGLNMGYRFLSYGDAQLLMGY